MNAFEYGDRFHHRGLNGTGTFYICGRLLIWTLKETR